MTREQTEAWGRVSDQAMAAADEMTLAAGSGNLGALVNRLTIEMSRVIGKVSAVSQDMASVASSVRALADELAKDRAALVDESRRRAAGDGDLDEKIAAIARASARTEALKVLAILVPAMLAGGWTVATTAPDVIGRWMTFMGYGGTP
jgi:hypothetical protein